MEIPEFYLSKVFKYHVTKFIKNPYSFPRAIFKYVMYSIIKYFISQVD